MITLCYADIEILMYAYKATYGKTMDSVIYTKLVKVIATMEQTGKREVDLIIK